MKLLLKAALLLMVTHAFAGKEPDSKNINIQTHLQNYNAIACNENLQNCLALGFTNLNEEKKLSRVSYISEDFGKSWQEATPLPGLDIDVDYEDEIYNTALSCDEYGLKCHASHLIVIDKIPSAVIYKSLNGGKSWSKPKIVPLKLGKNNRKLLASSSNKINTTFINSDCDITATFCAISGGINTSKVLVPFALYSNNSGDTWGKSKHFIKPYHSSPSSIVHGTTLLDITCDQAGKRCKTVGNTIARNSFWNDYYSSLPVIYSSNNGGKSFGKPHIFPTKIKFDRGDTLQSINCNKDLEKCTVIGYTIHNSQDSTQIFAFTTSNGGEDWSKKILIPTKSQTEFPTDIKCDSSHSKCILTAVAEERKNSLIVNKAIYYATVGNNKKQWFRHKLADTGTYNSQFIKQIVCDNDLNNCILVGYGS